MKHTTMSDKARGFNNLLETIKELRGENGCPWDKRQTTDSLVKYLHAEFAELIEAINNKDAENICEEAGDLLYLLIMIAEINHDACHFSIDDVIRSINSKLIRRHPHVFAGKMIGNEDELKQQWQTIKDEEKSGKIN